jgi:hypothetical protein
MKAFAEAKCFRRGHDCTGEWGRTIDLILQIIATAFLNRQMHISALSARPQIPPRKFPLWQKESAMKSWKNATLSIIGFVLIVVSGIMGSVLGEIRQ